MIPMINYSKLKQVCLSPVKSFEGIGDMVNTPDGILIYKENPKAKILGVSHLDSVLEHSHFYNLSIGNDVKVINAQLDDRLGTYTLLEILPRLGIEFDLLLTEGEEIGRSTAAHFEPIKEYNWIFSFDRAGSDVVMYQYDTPLLRNDLKSAKFRPSYGTFSDICFLDHLGVRGINIGTGYHDEHTDMCHASMGELTAQVKRFKAFYDMFEDKQYPYEKPASKKVQSWHDDFYCYLCDRKPGKNQIVNDIFLCDDCMGQALQCQNCMDLFYADEIVDGLCEICSVGAEQKYYRGDS
jgi:hypothetical protein